MVIWETYKIYNIFYENLMQLKMLMIKPEVTIKVAFYNRNYLKVLLSSVWND